MIRSVNVLAVIFCECLKIYLEFAAVINQKKERNVLFNDALGTFYSRLYGVGHMVKDHSDSER